MANYRNLEIPAVGLASCVIGLIVSPYLYIASGALFQFPPVFSLAALPPLLFGSGFLLWRFFAKPTERGMSLIAIAIEAISWTAIVIFLILISRFSLFTAFERAGLFCTFFLLASVLCLPLLSLRNTALKQRLKKLPGGVAIAVLILVLASSGLLVIIYQLSPPQFI